MGCEYVCENINPVSASLSSVYMQIFPGSFFFFFSFLSTDVRSLLQVWCTFEGYNVFPSTAGIAFCLYQQGAVTCRISVWCLCWVSYNWYISVFIFTIDLSILVSWNMPVVKNIQEFLCFIFYEPLGYQLVELMGLLMFSQFT